MALACWAWSNWLRTAVWSRLFWTFGCLANVGHLLIAMHIVYAWDHNLAYTAVAAQTFEMTGLDSGIGLYINYCFSGLWLLDTASWWLLPHHYKRRPRWLDGILQFIFFFMFFNATVVFGKSSIRLLGAVLCPLGVIGWFQANFWVDRNTV